MNFILIGLMFIQKNIVWTAENRHTQYDIYVDVATEKFVFELTVVLVIKRQQKCH